MRILLEILLSFLTALGLLTLVWMLFGRLLRPGGAGWRTPVYMVLRAEGGGGDLEQTVNGLLWLNKKELAALRIVIADAGLDETGRAAARLLAGRWAQVRFCPLEALPEYIEKCE